MSRPGRTLAALLAGALLVGGLVSAGRDSVGDVFRRATDAYRRGAWEQAEALWRSTLEADLGDVDRARVLYDLGNTAWRRGEVLRAVGWYTACLRLDPHNADARANLELSRSKAGLEPADRGDLRSTLRRLVGGLRPEERRLLVLAALGILAGTLLLEALRGGSLWRGLSWLALAGVLAAGAPWVYGLVREEGDPVLVIGTPSVALRSEPRASLDPIGRLQPGEEVQRIDQLPGWVRVETVDGTRAWVPDASVFVPPRPGGS